MATTTTQFTELAKCIAEFDENSKKAMLVHFLLKRAVALGAVSTYDLAALETNTACFRFNPLWLSAIDVVIAYNKAVAASAVSVSLDKELLAEAIKCLHNKPPMVLDNMARWLRDQMTT